MLTPEFTIVYNWILDLCKSSGSIICNSYHSYQLPQEFSIVISTKNGRRTTSTVTIIMYYDDETDTSYNTKIVSYDCGNVKETISVCIIDVRNPEFFQKLEDIIINTVINHI